MSNQLITELPGLVAWYPHTEGSGTTLNDYSGSNNGTLTASPAWIKIPNGLYGIDYDGSSSQYTTIPDSNDFSFTDGSGNDLPFSISMWVNPSNLSGTNKAPIERFGTSGTFEYSMIFNTSNNIQFNCFTSTASGFIGKVTTNAPLSTSTWQFITITYDGSEVWTGIKIYIDGVEQTSFTSVNSGTYTGMSNTTVPLSIAARFGNGTRSLFYSGSISNILIAKGAEWSPELIKQLYRKTYIQ